MPLTPAQFGVLSTLKEHGPQVAIQTVGPVGMDGKRKTTLQWNMGSIATLRALCSANLVVSVPGEIVRPKDATGRPGKPRRNLTISITSAGLSALAS